MRQAMEKLLYDAGVDMVFAGHVHAYERCVRSYNMQPDAAGPYYITIGDGGNREGLATSWINPQPVWSAFRQASYGHGELEIVNATHAVRGSCRCREPSPPCAHACFAPSPTPAQHWTWHQNPDLEPTIADELWVVKGASAEMGRHDGASGFAGVTAHPIFRSGKAGAVRTAHA